MMYKYGVEIISSLYRSCITCNVSSENVDYYIDPLGLIVDDNNNNNNNKNNSIDGKGNHQYYDIEIVQPILAHPTSVRLLLAKWLPVSLRLNKLHLLYSTDYHGRTLERLYFHLKHAKHTILLCEVLDKPSSTSSTTSTTTNHNKNNNTKNNTTTTTKQQKQQRTIIGMYASQTWKVSTQVYGDGNVFLFRIEPNPKCWKWKPTKIGTGKSLFDASNINHMTLLEQFMVGTNRFISMGGNSDGSSGLRINDDLTKGESATAPGFDNEPLHHYLDNNGTSINTSSSMFDIGLLEVYGFVRQTDGRYIV